MTLVARAATTIETGEALEHSGSLPVFWPRLRQELLHTYVGSLIFRFRASLPGFNGCAVFPEVYPFDTVLERQSKSASQLFKRMQCLMAFWVLQPQAAAYLWLPVLLPKMCIGGRTHGSSLDQFQFPNVSESTGTARLHGFTARRQTPAILPKNEWKLADTLQSLIIRRVEEPFEGWKFEMSDKGSRSTNIRLFALIWMLWILDSPNFVMGWGLKLRNSLLLEVLEMWMFQN